MHFDVFNGDADGLCALVQLRQTQPKKTELVSGVKRDVALVAQVPTASAHSVTVLDISFEKNAEAVVGLLDAGIKVDYFDHHKSGLLITHPKLVTHINTAADTCTALIVDHVLQGRFKAWALTAAYGDNLSAVADKIGVDFNYSIAQLQQLKTLGIYLNYNGYGATLADLFYHPATLYQKLAPYGSPFDFLQEDGDTFQTLENGYREDMAKARQANILHETDSVAVVCLPNKRWARRVSGVYSNALTNRFPDRAHAVLTEKPQGAFLVSVRAPLNQQWGADELVSQFASGGGRKAAAGINHLPDSSLTSFVDAFEQQFAG